MKQISFQNLKSGITTTTILSDTEGLLHDLAEFAIQYTQAPDMLNQQYRRTKKDRECYWRLLGMIRLIAHHGQAMENPSNNKKIDEMHEEIWAKMDLGKEWDANSYILTEVKIPQ